MCKGGFFGSQCPLEGRRGCDGKRAAVSVPVGGEKGL